MAGRIRSVTLAHCLLPGTLVLLAACGGRVVEVVEDDDDASSLETDVEEDRCTPGGGFLAEDGCAGKWDFCGHYPRICENMTAEDCHCGPSLCWDRELERCVFDGVLDDAW